ncbi:beta strand repeat-containing protein [Rhodococcus sp. WS3]|uniref:beta strand repeat-containing protein n=1 Tax=Rhodococcus sp. WS3 TaxID=2486271 RepID=UPI001650F9C6|nr:Ig-like domain-containing protein [Rhodococcus sp. WS3]
MALAAAVVPFSQRIAREGSKYMKDRKLRRLLAGVSTAAMALGFATTFGVMTASAAPVSTSTASGSWTFNRTISNGTPVPGETITVTNNIRWNGGLAPTISAFKDIHPDCLTYVVDSSKVAGNGVGTSSTSTSVSMTGSWIRSAVDRNIDYTVKYTVGQNCARDVALITGAGISANQGTGSETANTGPSITVAKAATQTSLTVAPAPQADRASTLTATVTTGATGNVDFLNNGNLLGTGTIANGTATYAWTPSGADAGQPYSITAKYLSDATNAVSTSAAQTGTVAAAPTAPAAPTAVTVNPTSVVVGGTVTVSGTAEANSEVTVIAGEKTCKVTAGAAGAFSCDIVTSEVGTLTVTAVAANAVGVGPISAPVTVTVLAPPDVDTTLGLSVPSVATAGVAVDLTATVAPASAVGSVSFKVGGVEVGTASVSNGVATLSHTFAAAGVQSVTADFSGAGFVASSAGPSSVTVSDPVPVDVETSLVLGVPAVATAGVAVDLTATVAPASAVGSVSFKVGGVEVGSAVVSNGVATVSHTFAAAGVQSVTADFSGAGFVASSAGPSSVTVSDPVPVDVDTTLGLTVPASATTGVAVDLTATVAPANAVGSVQFQDNGVDIGSAVTVVGGVATMNNAFASAGAHSITANFTAGAGFNDSVAAAKTVTVSDPVPVDVDTTLGLSVPASATPGVAVDLTATVAPASAVGSVSFKVGGVEVGTASVSNGVATLSHTFASAGVQSVTADFSGVGFVASSAGPSTVTVSDPVPVDVDTTLGLSVPSVATTGVAVDLTATVAPASAVGSVSFKVGGVEVGSAVVSNGVATVSHTFASAGVQSVTADFSGAGFVASSAGPSTVTVSDAVVVDTTSTTVLSVAGEAKVGVELDLSAAVAGQPSGDPAPSGGTVTFKVDGVGVGSVPVVNGAATLPHTFNTAATVTVTAVYSGSGTLAGSTSNAETVNVTVEAPTDVDTTTTLNVPASGVVGKSVQLKANVSPLGSVGTVQFFEGNVPLGAAVDVVNGVAVLDHTFATAGNHSITAVFSGGPGMKESESTGSTINVTEAGTEPGGSGSLGNIFGS